METMETKVEKLSDVEGGDLGTMKIFEIYVASKRGNGKVQVKKYGVLAENAEEARDCALYDEIGEVEVSVFSGIGDDGTPTVVWYKTETMKTAAYEKLRDMCAEHVATLVVGE